MYNTGSRKIERFNEEDYIRAYLDSFNNRVNWNSRDYNVQNLGGGKVLLVDNGNSSNRKNIKEKELEVLKRQNED